MGLYQTITLFNCQVLANNVVFCETQGVFRCLEEISLEGLTGHYIFEILHFVISSEGACISSEVFPGMKTSQE